MATVREVWVPAFVFGNVFAFVWVFVMLLMKSPVLQALWARFLPWRRRGKPSASDSLNSEIQSVIDQFREMVGANDGVEETSNAALEDLPEGAEHLPTLPSPELVKRHVSRSQSTILTPLRLEWRDIGCVYKTGKKSKTVLQGVCGKVEPRQMLALVGPSGSGKSTLLDILTMRKNVGEISGDVLINGRARTASFLRNAAYVSQEDSFVPTMTVLETMMFYAWLVLPNSLSVREKRHRALDVLNMLGLGDALQTMVGGLLPGGIHFRGLSGGERRRLSIATGVVSAPSAIFLDEPTTGLDSFAALNVMQYMRNLADCKSHTIVASIHQPRSGIWNLFDQALVLSQGRMLYSGAQKSVLSWFTGQLYYDYDPAVNGVVSDWLLDLLSVGYDKPKELYGDSMMSLEDVVDAATQFGELYRKEMIDAAKTSLWEDARQDERDCVVKLGKAKFAKLTERQSRHWTDVYEVPWFSQFRTLYWRSFLNITRNPADVAGRMLTFTYVALFIGLIFYALPDGAASVITRLNLLFNCVAFFLFIPYISVSLFTADRLYYSADVQAKLYRPSAYYCANVSATLPFSVINAAVFALVVYGMAGLRHEMVALVQNVSILTVESLIATQVLHFAATVTPNQDMAFMLTVAFTAVNILLSNFFIPFEQITLGWVYWLKWISVMGYTWNAVTKIEFDNRTFSCAQRGTMSDFEEVILAGLPSLNPTQATLFGSAMAEPSPDCTVTSDHILQFFGIELAFWNTLSLLLSYLLFLHIFTFAVLKFAAVRDKK